MCRHGRRYEEEVIILELCAPACCASSTAMLIPKVLVLRFTLISAIGRESEALRSMHGGFGTLGAQGGEHSAN